MLMVAALKTLTFNSDVVFDDIVILQRDCVNAANVANIKVSNGATMVIGENVQFLHSTTVNTAKFNSRLTVDAGATLVIKAGGKKNIGVSVLPENASDPSLTYEILPADGMLTIVDGVLTVSEDAISGANYEIIITNPRSAVSATVQVTISSVRGLTAWTIGDSIFDFRDNSESDMVQSFLKQSGYVNLYMDNIAGSTVRAASGVGVIEHIQSGMYDAWEEPDLIVLFRGTNDAYFGVQQPHFFTPESIEKAVEDTCIYFSENYPDARIVWATPLWRADVAVEKVDWIRSLIHTYCAQYGIEVFDLHLTEDFASLSHENFGAVLYDGIHLTDLGANYLKDAFMEYLTK
jgi:hypothetical protein